MRLSPSNASLEGLRLTVKSVGSHIRSEALRDDPPLSIKLGHLVDKSLA